MRILGLMAAAALAAPVAAEPATAPNVFLVSVRGTGTATGECPPNPPLNTPTFGCRTYDGVLTLQLKIARGTVSVSARHRAFQPAGPCPGSHSVGIPPSTGTVDLTRLAARRVTVVSGQGAEASESERQTFARTAQFQAPSSGRRSPGATSRAQAPLRPRRLSRIRHIRVSHT